MELFNFLIIYVGLAAGLIFTLLFGELPAFRGTPVSCVHWAITQGWADGIEWIVGKAFGEKGLRVLDAVATCCCDRPNPALQITYLAMFGGGYYLYWQHVFRLLPNRYAGEVHLWTGTATVCLCLTLFLAASMSDPGTISASTSAQYLRAYPPDGAIFPRKSCTTCGFERPARSKHCTVCGRCVARFDHHCAWINNCVGLANMRTFLAFLAANMALCCYGAVLTPVVLAGEMRRRGAFELQLYNPTTRQRMPLWKNPARLAEWLFVFYPIPVAIEVFFIMSAIITSAFLSYQCWLIARGTTTYELFKWRQLRRELEQQIQEAAGAALAGRDSAAAAGAGAAATGAAGAAACGVGPTACGGPGSAAVPEAAPAASWPPSGGPLVADGAGGGGRGTGEGGCGERSLEGPGRGWLRWALPGMPSSARPHPVVVLPANRYHRGVVGNFAEVLLPDRFLEENGRAAVLQAGPTGRGGREGCNEQPDLHPDGKDKRV